SNDGSGILTWDEIAGAIHHNSAYYVAPTGLIALENSHNLAGGSVLTRARTADICARAHEKNLPVHLDGARIFNAAAALGETIAELVGVKIDPEKVVTNIVIFDVAETGQTADAICAQLREHDILASGFGSSIRMVTHCDVARADIETALSEMRAILNH